MEYLFFDIECANCDGGNGKICSFGYVLADSILDVMEKRDIVINPKAPFKLKGWGNKYYINLSYPEEEFLGSPEFPFYYNKIKELLTENRIVFGYAPENDAGFLRSEFDRYGLEPIDFTFYDVQRLHKLVVSPSEGNLRSLAGACADMGIDTSFTEHKSCDDAHASLLLLKKLCEMETVSPEELTERFTPCRGELKNGEIYADYFRRNKPLSPEERNYLKGDNKDAFRSLIRKLNNMNAHGMLYGKKVCFSRLYEYRHFSEMCVLVSKLRSIGGLYTDKVRQCDIFVKTPTQTRGVCDRLEDAEALREQRGGQRPSIMSFDGFLTLINMDKNELAEAAEAGLNETAGC